MRSPHPARLAGRRARASHLDGQHRCAGWRRWAALHDTPRLAARMRARRPQATPSGKDGGPGQPVQPRRKEVKQLISLLSPLSPVCTPLLSGLSPLPCAAIKPWRDQHWRGLQLDSSHGVPAVPGQAHHFSQSLVSSFFWRPRLAQSQRERTTRRRLLRPLAESSRPTDQMRRAEGCTLRFCRAR